MDAVQGAWVQVGTISVNPASVAAGARGTVEVAITGIGVGDQAFLNAQTLEAGLVVTGCKATATDILTVYVHNTTAGGIDGAALTYDVLIIHN